MTEQVKSTTTSAAIQGHAGIEALPQGNASLRGTDRTPGRAMVLAVSMLSAGVLSSCSSWFSGEPPLNEAARGPAVEVASDGVVVVAGPVPPIQPLDDLLSSARALGFAPVSVMHDGLWLSVDRAPNDRTRGRVALMDGARKLLEESVVLSPEIESGTFSLKHKQRQAAWHAPEEYFARRGLPVPGEGERGRFLRGAYGEFALFWDKSAALHSGPMTLEGTKAIQVREDVLSQLYYSLPIGAPIEVR